MIDEEDGTIAFTPVGSLALSFDDPGWPGVVKLYRCPLCSCLIAMDDVQQHAGYHEGER